MEDKNPSQPIPPIVEQQPPITPKRRFDRKWLLIGVVALVLIPLVLLVFPTIFSLFYFRDYIKLSNDSSFAPKIAPQTTISPDVIAGWKTFAGQYVGISFKYPSDWHEVDSEYVSQEPTEDVFGDGFDDYRDKGKIANLIWIYRYSKDIDVTGYNRVLKYYETLKSAQLDKELVDLEASDGNIKKVKEGKISSGQNFVTYLTYTYDYELENPEDENSKEIKVVDPDTSLVTYIKDSDTIYEMIFGYHNAEGDNIFHNIIQTAKITNKPLADRTLDNKIFSIKYPPYSKLEEIKEEDGGSRFIIDPVSTNSDIGSITISTSYIDPQKFGNGSFKVKGTWWNEVICNEFFDPSGSDENFSYINGYSSLSGDTGTSVINKPYIVNFYTEDNKSIKYIKQIASTIKLKAGSKTEDQGEISYLKMPTRTVSNSVCQVNE